MNDVFGSLVVQLGGPSLVLVLLVLRFWRSEGGYGQLFRALREDAATARKEATALRELLEQTEEKCRADIAALRARVEHLERGQQ